MKPRKLGVYRRVSTDDQVNVYEGSLESQKYRNEEFVRFKNSQAQGTWGHIVDYYDEEGVSAGTTNRPEYQRLMTDIRKGKIDLILVTDLTRLSRNLLDFCNLINELESYKASYLSMKEQFDTSTPIGRMMVYIIIALGQFERETTSERVSINVHTRAVKGLMNGGPAPLGYDRHPNKPGLLVINEQEAEVVRTIFRVFLEEGSRSRTIAKLHEKEIFPKRSSQKAKNKGQVEWTVQSLRSLLQNPAYIGLREVNKLYKDEDPNDLKPWQKHQTVKANWEPLLDETTFHDAQELIEEAVVSERSRLSKSANRHFLLTGILKCGETGLPLTGQTGHGRSGTVHTYYHYARRPKGIASPRPRLSQKELEEKVIAEFKRAISSNGYFDELESTIREQNAAKFNGHRSESERLKTELQHTSEKIGSILQNQARMNLNEDALSIMAEELNRLAQKKQALEKQLRLTEEANIAPESAKFQALFVHNQIRACLQGWAKASPSVQKRLLRRTIKEIVVTHDEMLITFWMSNEEQAASYGTQPVLDGNEKILPIRGRLRSNRDRNDRIAGSGDVRNGSERRT